MKSLLSRVFVGIMIGVLLIGCNVNTQGEKTGKQDTKTTLPDGFPTDFPFPENIKITEVRDKSEGSKGSYTIRFTFDPDIDLDATFKMYDDYTKKIGYEVILGGTEYFANGIFQYGANEHLSTTNMFVVTLKPDDGTYGSIDLKIEK